MSMATTPALEDTWRLEDIYETPQAFRAEKDRLGGLLPGLATHAGRLGGSARDMADALETITDAGKALARLHTYASMLSDQDLRVPANQAMRQEVELAFTEMSRRTAWLRPEILALPDGTVERFLSTEPRLAPFAHFLRNLVRQKAHVLSPAEEGLRAEAAADRPPRGWRGGGPHAGSVCARPYLVGPRRSRAHDPCVLRGVRRLPRDLRVEPVRVPEVAPVPRARPALRRLPRGSARRRQRPGARLHEP